MEASSDYNFNLFRPLSKYGRKNRNMILTLLSIWVVAVFGFQILLRVLEKPVAEESLPRFEKAFAAWQNGSTAENRELIQSLVMVAGKQVVKTEDRALINDAITWFFYGLADDSNRLIIANAVNASKTLRGELSSAKDDAYLQIKQSIVDQQRLIIEQSSTLAGLPSNGLEAKILAHSLQAEIPAEAPDEVKLPALMKHYLTHYQSVLTDTPFLGFPFHYFYTAVFLLIMFVVLCLAYNILLGRRQRLEGIDE